jgi:hypothetical protein
MTRRSFKSLDDEKTYKMRSKLQYRYTGPHTVTEVYNPVTYKASIDGFSRIVHANRMKRDNRRDVSRKMKCQLRIGCAFRTVSLNVSSHGVMKASAREDAV